MLSNEEKNCCTDTIPEIPKMLEAIKLAEEQDNLVVFVGAGVSRIIGYPSWDELAKRILDRILKEEWINFYEYTNLQGLPAKKLITICLNNG